MKNEIRFALCAIKKNIQSSSELRFSFVLQIIGMMINNIAFLVLWGVFSVVSKNIGGWDVYDVFLLQGFTAFVFGIFFSCLYGFVEMPQKIHNGSFDMYLLAPKNILNRIAFSSFRTSGIGDVFFGVICFIVYGVHSGVTLLSCVLFILLLLSSFLVFSSMVFITNSIAFYVENGTQTVRGLFELFFTPSLFYGGAFQGKMRFFFTFIIPSLLIGTLPVEILKHTLYTQGVYLFLGSILWCILALFFFSHALKKYESGNAMGFGS